MSNQSEKEKELLERFDNASNVQVKQDGAVFSVTINNLSEVKVRSLAARIWAHDFGY